MTVSAARDRSDPMAKRIVVFSTISAKEVLIELVPEFERTSGNEVEITYSSGPGLTERIRGGLHGDLFIGPEEFSNPLITEGKLLAGSRRALARSSTALAIRAGVPKPDIGTPEKLKDVLLAARTIAWSSGASGMHFLRIIRKLGIGEKIEAKRVPARPGELIANVVARGEADIGVQQVSELLPVPGIQIVEPLPAELRHAITYGATAFPQSTERETAQAFIAFLKSDAARGVWRSKGLEPV
jgi:molybdate transport system substrate-binding protein